MICGGFDRCKNKELTDHWHEYDYCLSLKSIRLIDVLGQISGPSNPELYHREKYKELHNDIKEKSIKYKITREYIDLVSLIWTSDIINMKHSHTFPIHLLNKLPSEIIVIICSYF